jgi:hypothetical protein
MYVLQKALDDTKETEHELYEQWLELSKIWDKVVITDELVCRA